MKRYKKVRLSYLDRNGNYLIEELANLPAIVAQHEYDHLNGILFTTRLKEQENSGVIKVEGNVNLFIEKKLRRQ